MEGIVVFPWQRLLLERVAMLCYMYISCVVMIKPNSSSSSSFYWTSVANAPNVLQPYWLIALPLDVPDLTASLLP